MSIVPARYYLEGGGGPPDVDIFTPSGEVTERKVYKWKTHA